VPRTAKEVMTTRVVSVLPDDPASRAVDLLRRYGFSALPVADRGYHLVGMISLLDVLRWREAHPEDTEDPAVGEIMTRDVRWMRPSAKLTLVGHRLRTYGELRVMPIVERGVLVGVVTRSDLLQPRASLGDRIRRRLRRDDRDEPLLRMARARRHQGQSGGRPTQQTSHHFPFVAWSLATAWTGGEMLWSRGLHERAQPRWTKSARPN